MRRGGFKSAGVIPMSQCSREKCMEHARPRVFRGASSRTGLSDRTFLSLR